MDALIVIPARYASTRLPGKPLLAETGKPMIQHTYERAAASGARVLVATDDPRIAEAVTAFGGEAVMTRADHETGSARVAEAAEAVMSGMPGMSGTAGRSVGIVVNVQGDEPEIDPEAISTLIDLHARALASSRPALLSTLVSAFPDASDPASPDAVKAVLSEPGPDGTRSALWFSRSLIPYPRAAASAAQPLLHIGLYAYAPAGLRALMALPPTPAERAESLEQLRVLEHGHRIAARQVAPAAPGIDTPADYAAFVARCKAAS